MTQEQEKIYTQTVKRLARGGIKDPTAQIVALAEEIDRYRNRIYQLEQQPPEVLPASITPSPPHRYTQYDPELGRFVIPLLYTSDRDSRFCFRLGMTLAKYPDCVFGDVIDKLARYENQDKEAKP